jgi:hypothetical protein
MIWGMYLSRWKFAENGVIPGMFHNSGKDFLAEIRAQFWKHLGNRRAQTTVV